MNERELREAICLHGKSLFDRGLTSGSSGNISVRLPDSILRGGMLVTPTNSCMGRLDPDRISKVDASGALIGGDQPSKEWFLHASVYRSRGQDSAVVHLHSTYSVAVSCLTEVNPQDVLPPITAYYVMRVGRLQMIPYFAPGDRSLAEAVATAAETTHSLLLANHGPVIAAPSLETAVYATEELEETAKLYLLLRGQPTRFLTPQQRAELENKNRSPSPDPQEIRKGFASRDS